MIDDKSLAEIQNKDNYQIFCEYFNELEKEGIGYGVGDLYRKARELDLPLPKPEEILTWLNAKTKV